MKKALIALSVILTGCANYRPVVDMQGVDGSRYEADLATCQQYATQVSPGEQAGIGAAGGAVLLGIIGGILGNRQSVGQGAAIGALYGGTAGAAHGADSQINIVRRCMAGRGYRVLN